MGYNKWINMIKPIKFLGCGFGVKKLILRSIPQRIREQSKICRSISESCDRTVMSYLKKYLSIIRQYDHRESKEYIGSGSNIWMLWWQGYEKAPEVVKACISSIRRNAGDHPVVLLDQYNYEQYITLPDHVIDKFEKGCFSLAQLSDMIRTSLLYQYGGIWMDATLYMVHPFDEIIETRTFYSINRVGGEITDPSIVQFGHWIVGFLACGKGNHIIGLLNKLLFEYWKHEETVIDYHFMDFFLAMIYWNVESAKRIIDDIKVSNRAIYKLEGIINENRDALKQLPDDGTYIYRITYQKRFSDSVNGEETIYHMLVHEGWDGSLRSGSV